jgi:Flp pilus assembly pilin Flp
VRLLARAGRAVLRVRVRSARGASSVEYGLLVALIGGAVCLGIGLSLKSVFQDAVCSLMSQLTSTSCGDTGTGPGIPGTGDGSGGTTGPGGGGGPVPTVTPTPTPSPTPTPTPTPTP